MKSVSSSFEDIWARKYGRKEVLKVLYKRRYWNGAAYAYESSWQTLSQAEVPGIRSINWKLDFPKLNEQLASNVVLRLENMDMKWFPGGAPPSVFAQDNTATVGYEPYSTKFQVQFGYILDDGTKEYTALFTGLAESYRFDAKGGVVEVTVSGNERLLKDADAENVSTDFTLENCSPATGDGSNKTFTTTSTGVGGITVVQVNGVTMAQGTDYTISALNETGAASISFTVAPGAGQTVKSTGFKWYAGRTIEYMVGLLCDEAGVDSGSRTINSVVLPGSLSGSKTIDSQANWEAGSVLTNVDTTYTPDSLLKLVRVDKFEDGDYASDPAWTVISDSGLAWTVRDSVPAENCSGKLLSHNGVGVISTPRTQSGTEIEVSWIMGFSGAAGGIDQTVSLDPMSTNNSGTGNGYRVKQYVIGGTANTKVDFIRVTGGVETVLGTYAQGSEAIFGIAYKFVRDSNGLITVYFGGSPIISVTDTTYTAGSYMVLKTDVSGGAFFDEIFHNDMIAAVWESAEQDIGATPAAWGILERTETLNGGTITYKTASSTSSGGTYSSYQEIASDGTIQSPLRRYFKIRVEFTIPSGSFTSPQLDKLIARFSTNTVVMAIANFSGKTVYSAIQRLAQIADYEWGFDGDGLFFFRSKVVSGDGILSIDQENAISALSDYQLGYDTVITHGRVRYGDYFNEFSCSNSSPTEDAPTPQDRFGDRVSEEDLSDILLANDSSMAGAKAQLLHDNNHKPKKRMRVTCRLIPHIDLSDVITVTYIDRPRDRNPMLGDPMQTFGDSSFGPAVNVLANGMRMKVIGITHSLDKTFKTDLDLQEVLS